MISTIVNNYQLSTVSKNLFSAQFEKKQLKNQTGSLWSSKLDT